jgi:hypothetical protein
MRPYSRRPAAKSGIGVLKKLSNASFPRNWQAWALGSYEVRRDGRVGRFHVRRVVWGRLLAREEKRPGEVIRRAYVLIRRSSGEG